ncbi:hypothetical protein GJ496_006326 [Pomphorhynchus laevis]|nr:hypothetical protein GJ496_006326 [Pomphorhynchus laevis]
MTTSHNFNNEANDNDGKLCPIDEQIQAQCCQSFDKFDFIMEPQVFQCIKTFLKHNGLPEVVIDKLSDNFVGITSATNRLCQLLIESGVSRKEIMSIVHRSFEQFLLQHFNPTEMDATLLRYQKIPHWLMTLISVPCWRNLILKLADSYPQCGLLRFAIRATLECGIEHCIHSLSVSTQDVHVCLKMVSYFVKQLMIKPNMHGMEETLRSIGRITSISECTYVITLLFLRRMQELSKTASVLASCMKRLIFEIEQQTLACQLDVVAFGLALRGTIMFPDVYDSLTTIIAKGAAESVELTLLNRFYEASLEKNSSNCCDFMRHPVLIDVLLKLLFCINMKMRLTNEDKIKAVSILSHSISIRFYNSEDTLLNPNSERSNKNDISEIRDAISEAIGICENFCSERLQVFQLIKLSRYLGVTLSSRLSFVDHLDRQMDKMVTSLCLAPSVAKFSFFGSLNFVRIMFELIISYALLSF